MLKPILVVLIVSLFSFAIADELVYEPPWYGGCPNFTQEQIDVLTIAIDIGGRHDQEVYDVIGDHLRYTTMAILTRESFVGTNIIRQRHERKSRTGSYGVMHVTVTTAFHDILEMRYTWHNRNLFETGWIVTMLTDDRKAVEAGYFILKKKIIQHGSLWAGVRAYNGAGVSADRYLIDVKYRVSKLIECGY